MIRCCIEKYSPVLRKDIHTNVDVHKEVKIMDNTKNDNINRKFTMDEILLREIADGTISAMFGIIIRNLVKENEKDHPDEEVIKRLQREKKELHDEEQRMIKGDINDVQGCIDKYSPILRADYSK